MSGNNIRDFFAPKPKKEPQVIVLSDSDDNAPKKRSASPTKEPVAKKAKIPGEEVAVSSFFSTNKVQQVSKKVAPPPPSTIHVASAKKPKKKPADEFDEFDDGLLAEISDDMLDAKKYSQTSDAPSQKTSPAKTPKKTPKSTPKKTPNQPLLTAESWTKKSPNKEVVKPEVKQEVKQEARIVKEAIPAKDPTPVKTDTSDDVFKTKSEPGIQLEKLTSITDAKFFNKKGVQKAGNRPVPEGKPYCLQGLTFVLTGELPSITRTQAMDLIKLYGGKTTVAPSGKTDYIITGEYAGPAKLDMAKQKDIKTVDEEGFFNLIATLPAQKPQTYTPTAKKINKENSSELWTVKYAPTKIDDIVGHQTFVKKLQDWLRGWDKARENGFKSSHKDDIHAFRAVLLSGPPGIGKTTMAHIVSKSEGWQVVEFNASDTRSKKSLQDLVRELTGNHTVTEYFKTNSGGLAKATKAPAQKTVIIMDEVDGMSGGDRGGNAELIQMIKTTKTPIICICNDRQAAKVRTLANYCFDMRLRRPDAKSIAKRVGPIAAAEGIQVPVTLVEEICRMTQSDIRQVLNMLSTWRLSRTNVDFVQGKEMAKGAEKQISSMSPFELIQKLLRAQEYNETSFNDKMDLFFIDYQMLPLFVQENYIRCGIPHLAQSTAKNQKDLEIKQMDLMAQAAESLSDGDLVDNMIRGQQQWGLLPLQSVFSCVRPAYFCHGSPGQPTFPATLGNMSKTTKGYRLLRELQIHMRVHISGDKSEIRQSYLPALTPRLFKPLVDRGVDAVEEVINVMDTYYLTRDDWEACAELGLGPNYIQAIDTKTKTAFTKTYNKQSHPTPFLNQNPTKLKRTGTESKPDLEDVLDEEDEEIIYDDGSAAEEGSSDEIGNDKYIKEVKPKGKTAAKAAPKKTTKKK